MTPSSPPTSRPWTWTAALGALVVLVGLVALPSSIQAGDAGEFATVMLEGGVPHPSGYPWMRVLGVLARGLRALGVPPVQAAAAVGTLCATAGWMLLHRVCLAVMRPDPCDGWACGTAAFGVALIALCAPVVLHTVDSEVWGPLVLFASIVLWVALVRRAGPFWIGLAFGAAISHHLTAALLLPLCVGAAWPRPFVLANLARAAVRGVAGGLLGLLPYVSLMLGSGDAWRWGDTRSWAGLFAHVTRSEYGVFSLSLQQANPEATHQLARVGQSVGGALSAGLAPSALFGAAVIVVVMLVAMRRPQAPLPERLGLIGTAVVCTWLFPLAHNIEPRSDFGAWILERFDILSLVVLTPTLALAMAPLPGALRGRGRVAAGVALAAALLLVRQGLVTLWHGVPSGNPHVQRYAVDVLRTPPPGRAIVIGTDDHRLFPITFAQEVLGVGRQVLYIDASLLSEPWYRRHLRRRMPELPDVDKPVRLVSVLWNDPAWHDVPVYLTNDFSRPSRTLGRVPEGLLWRVIPPGKETSPTFRADRVLDRHRRALSRYGAPSREPLVGGHPFANDLRAAYTDTTSSLAQALKAEGRVEDAEALLQFAIDPPPPP